MASEPTRMEPVELALALVAASIGGRLTGTYRGELDRTFRRCAERGVRSGLGLGPIMELVDVLVLLADSLAQALAAASDENALDLLQRFEAMLESHTTADANP
jgi:hypothetical protein